MPTNLPQQIINPSADPALSAYVSTTQDIPARLSTANVFVTTVNQQVTNTYRVYANTNSIVNQAGGNSTEVQFKLANGAFGGDDGMTFISSSDTLTIAGAIIGNIVIVESSAESANNVADNALYVAGGAGFNGNVHANAVLHVGYAPTAPELTTPTIIASGGSTTYVQAALTNDDGYGSSDWAAYGDQSSDTSGWADMGYAGSLFNDPNYTITKADDGYFFVQGRGVNGGNLVIATGDQGASDAKNIIFATGGFSDTDEFARIEHANATLHLTKTGASLTFPDGTVQTTAFTGPSSNPFDQSLNTTDSPQFTGLSIDIAKQQTNTSTQCLPAVDTVVYVSTGQFQHTIKLLLQVEGTENSSPNWETQSCEMIVAKSFNGNKVVGSVYGLTYTSTNPLATFSTAWNATSSRIEITCRPSSTDAVWVRAFATEMVTSD